MVVSLGLLQDGEKGEIIDIPRKGKRMMPRIRDIGLFPGKVVEVLSNQGKGPILLKIEEAKIAIGRNIAIKIMVRRLK